MARQLTIAQGRDLPFQDLVERADELVGEFAAPDDETDPQLHDRLTRTLDQMPDIYRWFLTLESYFDHWADAYGNQYGMKSVEYKGMRERRDAMKRAASAAKMRYEGASRRITTIQGFDTEGMPRGR